MTKNEAVDLLPQRDRKIIGLTDDDRLFEIAPALVDHDPRDWWWVMTRLHGGNGYDVTRRPVSADGVRAHLRLLLKPSAWRYENAVPVPEEPWGDGCPILRRRLSDALCGEAASPPSASDSAIG